MTGMETKRASGKCIANALVCQHAELFCLVRYARPMQSMTLSPIYNPACMQHDITNISDIFLPRHVT